MDVKIKKIVMENDEDLSKYGIVDLPKRKVITIEVTLDVPPTDGTGPTEEDILNKVKNLIVERIKQAHQIGSK